MAKVEVYKDDNNLCFGCSPRNPIGLKLSFEHEGELCRCRFTARPEHQGWNDVVHGGIVATLLDECMAQWMWSREMITMTAEMKIRYSSAVPVGVELIIEASPVSVKGRLIEMNAKIILPDGSVPARASAKFLNIKHKS